VDGDLFWLVAFGYGLGFSALDEGVDGVDFPLLIKDPACELFTLLLVFHLVFLVLAEDFLVLLATDDDPFFYNMQLIQQARIILFGGSQFCF
jgi:hypothetical protein